MTFLLSFILNSQYPILYSLIFVIFCYVLAIQVWVYYLIVMKFKAVRDRNALPDSWFVKFHGYLILVVGVPLYILLNIIVGSILFLDYPREIQFTNRCQRYIKEGDGFLQTISFLRKYRKKVAKWICVNALDPFEEGGHC